ncbi:EAL and HDOD domain-containing protein [Peribacillus alkalitolerans]|uniref:EAL and HDOD domain-containing protein n=1 Tax=Peribacillus alkalitolerans TaxID=1550385 RepID=UPI0013D41434|nr:HDOD domain-containing protein [Peribacillus alkalitolerans]
MDVFVGRQPIFNDKLELFGYELLSRSGNENKYLEFNGDQATLDVLVNSFMIIGIEKLANRKKCFVNFTENLILDDLPTYFNKDIIVVELLEDIKPTPKVLEACARLKSLGYTIALDDFVLREENAALLEYADIIKIDFLNTDLRKVEEILKAIDHREIKLLAEKVENREDYEQALSFGFHLFQGYFFSKPVIINTKDVSSIGTQQYSQLLNKIDQPDPNINEIVKLVENDFALTYRLLKIVNSTAYHMRNRINSVKQAIIILGLNELRKWVVVLAFANKITRKNCEVIKISLCRAKFSESIAKIKKTPSSEYFLLGLFSLIDTILERPMEDILVELPLTSPIKEALLGNSNDLSVVLQLISSLERGNMVETSEASKLLNLEEKVIYQFYLDAIEWSDSLLNSIYYLN